jgi:hypothetical protein
MELNLKLGSKPMMDGWMDGWMIMDGCPWAYIPMSICPYLSFFLPFFFSLSSDVAEQDNFKPTL